MKHSLSWFINYFYVLWANKGTMYTTTTTDYHHCCSRASHPRILHFWRELYWLSEQRGRKHENLISRLLFTQKASNGVVVGVVTGVVIRSVEQYENQTDGGTSSERWLCLWHRRLRSNENCIVGVASRSGRINQWQCSIPDLAIGWFFNLLLLPTPVTQFSLDHKRRSRQRNRKKWKRSDSSDSDSVQLMTPLTTPIFGDFR